MQGLVCVRAIAQREFWMGVRRSEGHSFLCGWRSHGLDSEWPEPITEVGVDKKGTCHGCKGEIASFSDAVLVGGVRDSFFIGNACVLAIRGKFPLSEFRGIVNVEESDFRTAKVFGDSMEICE